MQNGKTIFTGSARPALKQAGQVEIDARIRRLLAIDREAASNTAVLHALPTDLKAIRVRGRIRRIHGEPTGNARRISEVERLVARYFASKLELGQGVPISQIAVDRERIIGIQTAKWREFNGKTFDQIERLSHRINHI